jgi:hypothetical protein
MHAFIHSFNLFDLRTIISLPLPLLMWTGATGTIPCSAYSPSLRMEAISFSGTLENIYQTTWCHFPEGSTVHTHCLENLKSHIRIVFFLFLLLWFLHIPVRNLYLHLTEVDKVLYSKISNYKLGDGLADYIFWPFSDIISNCYKEHFQKCYKFSLYRGCKVFTLPPSKIWEA